jgi:hypothetical protein
VSFAHAFSVPPNVLLRTIGDASEQGVGRCIGLDVHLEFIEVAICEEGQVWSAGRVPSTPEGIATMAKSLLATDRVALEVTGQLAGDRPAA